MDESIWSLCKGMASFCNHLESSCDALKTSVDRRPIPLDSASSTFLHSLNRRVSAASTHLNLLETMSFGTVSFEELLGHCSEVYKDNQTRLLRLPFSSELEIEDDDYETTPLDAEDGFDPRAIDEEDEDDSLLDESLSLKKLGLSDASLATLASQANTKNEEDPDISYHEFKSFKGSYSSSTENSGAFRDGLLSDFGAVADNKPKLPEAPLPLVKVSRDDYESLPSYMRSLAPWEDLLAAVEKINSGLKQKGGGSNFFHQDEISSLGLGPKARSYLLLLVRMNRLVVKSIDGAISYQVL